MHLIPEILNTICEIAKEHKLHEQPVNTNDETHNGFNKFDKIIKSLTLSERKELLAIFYLGRGDEESIPLSWDKYFDTIQVPESLSLYLSSKKDLYSNLRAGWEKIPDYVKSRYAENNKSIEKINQIISATQNIEKNLAGYLTESRERPEIVSRNILELVCWTREIVKAVKQNPYIQETRPNRNWSMQGWYEEKTNTILKSLNRLVERWIEDHDSVELLPNDYWESADEWIIGMLETYLYNITKYSEVVKEELYQTNFDLFDY